MQNYEAMNPISIKMQLRRQWDFAEIRYFLKEYWKEEKFLSQSMHFS